MNYIKHLNGVNEVFGVMLDLRSADEGCWDALGILSSGLLCSLTSSTTSSDPAKPTQMLVVAPTQSFGCCTHWNPVLPSFICSNKCYRICLSLDVCEAMDCIVWRLFEIYSPLPTECWCRTGQAQWDAATACRPAAGNHLHLCSVKRLIQILGPLQCLGLNCTVW